jgi:hypothetical protein
MLAFLLLCSAFSNDDSDSTPITTIARAVTVSSTPSPRRIPLFTSEVVDLPGLPTPNGTSYIVFFYSERCDQCINAGRAWDNIARMGAGLIRWAALNCDKYPRDCQYHAAVLEEPSVYLIEGNGSAKHLPNRRDMGWLIDILSARVPDQYVFVDRYNYTINPDERAGFLFMEGKMLPKLWTAVQNLLNRTDLIFYASTDRGLYEDLGLSKFPGIYAVKNSEFILFEKELLPRDIANFISDILPIDQAPGGEL